MESNLEYNIVVVAPALNEEDYIPDFIKSIAKQTIKPTEIVVVDNGSKDKTVELANTYSCVILHCKKRGVGPARAVGINYILDRYKNYLDKTIIIQLDCDEQIINTNYMARMLEVYKLDNDLMVTVGPIHYEIRLDSSQKETLETGKQFREVFDVRTLTELFTKSGRDINDYLIPGNHKLLAGGNTTYRASVFTLKNVKFPQDKSWESVVISVRIQQHILSSQIRFVEEQAVTTSNRSYTNSEGTINSQKLESVRKEGYIKPYKSRDSISPQQTVKNIIRQIDNETYHLAGGEYVEKVLSANKWAESNNYQKILPMLHGSTLEVIPNKYVLIKKLSAQ